jgi:hypothetical protein
VSTWIEPATLPNETWITMALLFGEPNNPDANRFEVGAGTITLFRQTYSVTTGRDVHDIDIQEALYVYRYYRNWYWANQHQHAQK